MNSLVSQQPVTEVQPFIRKIVGAVDLTARSLTTAEYAVKVAQSFGASLVCVYVHPIESMFNFVMNGGYDLVDDEQQHRRRALIELTETVAREYPFCTQTFLVGEPAAEIAKYAQEIGADLIVVASHHLNLLTSLLHLDQAPKVVHQATCPVLVYQGD